MPLVLKTGLLAGHTRVELMFTRRLISIIAMAGVVSIHFAGDFSDQAQVLADLRLQVTLLEPI